MVADSSALPTAIFVLTHIDVIPTELEAGVEYLEALVAESRKDEGNLRFNVLTQISRPNHMTLVETWEDLDAQAAHSEQPHSKDFRAAIRNISGSLYDERIYRRAQRREFRDGVWQIVSPSTISR